MTSNTSCEHIMTCVRLLTTLLLNPSEELKQKLLDVSRYTISLDAVDLRDVLDSKDLFLAEQRWVNQVAMRTTHPERVRTWNIVASIDEYLDQLKFVSSGEANFDSLESLAIDMMEDDIYVSAYSDDYSELTGLRPVST